MRKIYLTTILLLFTLAASGQISSFPHTTNFDAEIDCGTSCSGGCVLSGSWRNPAAWGLPSSGMNWLTHAGTTPSTATGPDFDHTSGTGKYAYGEASSCINTTCLLVSDIYNFSALGGVTMKFWYHMYGGTMGTLHLDVDSTGTGTWALDVIPAWTDNVNLWQEKTVNLNAYAGRPSVRLRFRGITGTSFTSDFAIDDILVFEPLPNDLSVSAIQAGGGCGNSPTTPVTLTLVNVGSDTIPSGTSLPVAFEITPVITSETFVTTIPYAPGDTFTYTFTTGFADLSGPSAITFTGWAAWTLDSAAGNDTVTGTATGIPVITSYPYFEDFELGQNGWQIKNGSVGTWAFGTPAKTVISSAGSGLNSFVTGGLGSGTYSDNDNSYVEGPCFDFSGICDPVIELKVWWNAEFSWDGMNVTASTDGGTTWSLVGAFGDPFTWYNDNSVAGSPGGFPSAWSGRNSTSNGSGGWVTARHRLAGIGGFPDVKIRINFGSDGSVVDDGVAFDDVHIFNGTNFGDDVTICSPSTAVLNADHGNGIATYAWSTGATSSSITVGTTGTYTVTITASPTCTVTESIDVLVIDSATTLSIGPDSSYCASTSLDAGIWPGCDFAWSTGDSTATIEVTTSGTYSVEITTPCGSFIDTVNVVINPNPAVDLGPDDSFCGGTLLDAGTGATFAWSTGDTTSTLMAGTSGTYSVEVTDSVGCRGSDTINVTINSFPIIDLGADSTLCAGDSLLLDAGAGYSYLWSDASTNQTLTVGSTGIFDVMVTDTSTGCVATDSISVTFESVPVAGFSFTIGATGLDYTFTDLSTGTVTTYAWDFGDGGTSSLSNPSHTYAVDGSYNVTLVVSNSCGSDTFFTSVSVVNLFAGEARLPMSVYPNPSAGLFHVDFEMLGDKAEISIQSIAGQQVYHRSLAGQQGMVHQLIDLSQKSAGIYLLVIRSGDRQSVAKIVLE